jgi:hypothetical protein
MDNKFFTLFKPYFDYMDSGEFFRKPFKWLYTILAIISLLYPLAILLAKYESFRYFSNKQITGFVLLWIVMAGVCFVGFQLWWNRRDKVDTSSNSSDEFVATPVFSHFIQTSGEWLGTFVGLVGLFSAMIGYILEINPNVLMGLPMIKEKGLLMVFLYPLYGFLIVVFSRFLAEVYRALTAIANNTKK